MDSKKHMGLSFLLQHLTAAGTHPPNGYEAILLINFFPAIDSECFMHGIVRVLMRLVFDVHKDRYIFSEFKSNRTKNEQIF